MEHALSESRTDAPRGGVVAPGAYGEGGTSASRFTGRRVHFIGIGGSGMNGLARMLLEPTNFLLLDEPTNHLDMRAKDVLLESLEKYTGTVVFVSHDRYFIDKLATRIFEIGDGEVHIFPGNYEDYLWRKEGKQIDLTLPGSAPATSHQPPATAVPAAKRLNPLKLKKMQDRCQELEQQIEQAESEIAGYEAELGNFVSSDETLRVSGLLEKSRAALRELLAEWEQVSELVESHQA